MEKIEVRCSECKSYVTIDNDPNDGLQPGTNNFWTWAEMFICETCFYEIEESHDGEFSNDWTKNQ